MSAARLRVDIMMSVAMTRFPESLQMLCRLVFELEDYVRPATRVFNPSRPHLDGTRSPDSIRH
jgi:hypothetical protein